MKKIYIPVIIILTIIFASFSVALSTDDPLITESYLNNVFMEEVKEYINSSSSQTFEVVTVEKNKVFTGNKGCEFILRKGNATVIASALGGLADTTGATDISGGGNVPPNHLLIVPRDDGRGFKANEEVIIMVKGRYTIK